jgi:glycosyltransferase involved in cell wall biosynthesis
MPTQPLLSILIPTCNRYQYLTKCLSSISRGFAKHNVEIIVQDSSDNIDKEYIKQVVAENTKVKYFVSTPATNFSDNFNMAYANSQGAYVCAVGDDDTINPELYDIVSWANQSNVDAVSQMYSAFYFWPDYRLKVMKRRYAGRLYIRNTNPTLWRSECGEALASFFASGCLDNKGLPKLYGGVVRRACLQRISVDGKAVFGGVSPDIYSCVAAALVVNTLYITDYPLFVAGSCGASNTCLAAIGKHTGGLLVPQLSKFRDLLWSPEVPAFYSPETVWAHSALEALRDMGRTDLIPRVNLSELYVRCLVSYPRYGKHTVQCILRLKQLSPGCRVPNKCDYIKSALRICKRYTLRVTLHLRNAVCRVLTGRKAWRSEVIDNVPDVDEALSVLQIWLSQKNLCVERLLSEFSAFRRRNDEK